MHSQLQPVGAMSICTSDRGSLTACFFPPVISSRTLHWGWLKCWALLQADASCCMSWLNLRQVSAEQFLFQPHKNICSGTHAFPLAVIWYFLQSCSPCKLDLAASCLAPDWPCSCTCYFAYPSSHHWTRYVWVRAGDQSCSIWVL